MNNSVLTLFKKSSWVILYGLLVFNLNSCGLVSNVREQGDSKSWIVAGKVGDRNGSIDSSAQFISQRVCAIKPVNEPINVNTRETASELKCNHSEDSYLVKHENLNSKFIIKNNSASGFLKLSSQRNNFKGKSYPISALTKTKYNLKSSKLSKENSVTNPKKNRAIFYALMSTLSLVIVFFMTETGSDILVGLFFVGAVILFIVSFIQMGMKPEICALQAVLTILLNILNIFLALIDLLLWAFMGVY